MAITPQDIQNMRFSEARRGYDPDEVDKFHQQIANDIDSMIRKIADLKNRLTESEAELAAARNQIDSQQHNQSEYYIDDAPHSDDYSHPSGVTEKTLSNALIAAQQTADRLVEEAKEESVRIRTEAEAKSREIIRETLVEKQREIDEISRLKESREAFRAEYLALVEHFMREAKDQFPEPELSAVPSGSGENNEESQESIEAVEVEEQNEVSEDEQAKQFAMLQDETVVAPTVTPYGQQADDFDMDDLD